MVSALPRLMDIQAIDCQLNPSSCGKTPELETAKPDAMKVHDRATLAREHAFDLVVAALSHGDFRLPAPDPFEDRRCTRCFLVGQAELAAREDLLDPRGNIAVDPDTVDLGHLVFG